MIERFDKKFKVRRDHQNDLLIRCRKGFVYEIGSTRLGVWLITAKPNASFNAIYRKWPEIKIEQLGNGQMVYSFPVRDDKRAMKFLRSIGAHLRRRMSAENRRKAIERLKKFGFKPQIEAALDSATGDQGVDAYLDTAE